MMALTRKGMQHVLIYYLGLLSPSSVERGMTEQDTVVQEAFE
jgi:hypothetical protein